jgi:hypothetical protein
MPSSVLSLRGRLEKLMRSWHPCLTKDFREVLESRSVTSSRGAADPASEHKQPYWLLLPRWLASVYGIDAGSKASHRRFVEDILWGQYCLFLCVKIHDDLYDRHTGRLSLLFAGDEFLLEAYRVFCLHFGTSSSFWSFFYSSLRESLQAIVALNDLQLGRKARRADLLKYYSKEYSLCKIGTYAVCLQADRMNDFSRAAAFSDEMAIVGQVVDDLQDMAKDLEYGHLNYAASFLLHCGNSKKHRSGQPLTRIARKLLLTDASTKLFRQLHQRLGRAEKLIRPLRLPEASRYLDFYRASLENMESHLHRERVKHIFGTRAADVV